MIGPVRSRATNESASRVLVVFEPGPNGTTALRQAVAVTTVPGAHLTVVTVARQSPRERCGPSAEAYDLAVRKSAQRDLREARDLLGRAAPRAHLQVLRGDSDRSLATWVADQEFDLVLLPHRRLHPRGHPASRGLRTATRAEIRVIGGAV